MLHPEDQGPNKVSVHVESSSPGWLMLADVWYPGWRAKIDGEQAPIHKADYLFRAVQVPAGAREVVFIYQPVGFYLGLGVSLLAWTSLGFLLLSWVTNSSRF